MMVRKSAPGLRILEYLGGIETSPSWTVWDGEKLILEYLGGIETLAAGLGALCGRRILEYLGGIETEYDDIFYLGVA